MMAATEEHRPPTIGERYSAATESSNLKLRSERRGDVDLIIAAGLSAGLGIRLWRLVDEFEKLDITIKVTVPTDDPRVRRALVYLDLPGLYEAKFEVFDHALILAARRGFCIPDGDIRILVGRCIESFLDNVCHGCKGTKVTGLYGTRQLQCRTCNGSGLSSSSIGNSDAERAFSRDLLDEMDKLLRDAEYEIRFNRKAVADAKDWIDQQAKS